MSGRDSVLVRLRDFLRDWGERSILIKESLPSLDSYIHEYEARILELDRATKEEGISANYASLGLFFLCLLRLQNELHQEIHKASSFLLDDGIFGAIWQDNHWHLDVNFHTDGTIEYVLLDIASSESKNETDIVDLEGFINVKDRLELDPLFGA